MAFLLKDEIELLEREIKSSSDKLFLDELTLKNLKNVLMAKNKQRKEMEELSKSMEESKKRMSAAMDVIINDKANNL